LDLSLLIFGNSTLTNEQNELVLKKVFDYIRKAERFLIVQCTFKPGTIRNYMIKYCLNFRITRTNSFKTD
jgi:hypothetical protein